MKLIRSKKKLILGVLLVVFLIFIFNINSVNAAINSAYYTAEEITDENLDESINNSSLLELLAKLVFAVGRFLEWIFGVVFKLLTGSTDFPWADKIVFNAVPLLDINFIHPDSKSFVGNSGITDLIKNLYSTILALAATFFGITVMITAIKLVISTIASEKAKYKQAIVDWVIGFVMLFCIHYFISFIFYLNEELVKVASQITINALNSGEAKAFVTINQEAENLIQRLENTDVTFAGEKVSDIANRNRALLMAWMQLPTADSSKGLEQGLMTYTGKVLGIFGYDAAIDTYKQYKRIGMVLSWAEDPSCTYEDISKVRVFTMISGGNNNSKINGYAVNVGQLYDALGKYKTDFLKALYNSDDMDIVNMNYSLYGTFPGYNGTNKVSYAGNINLAMQYYVPAADPINLEKNGYSFYISENGDFSNTVQTSFYWKNVIDELKQLKKIALSKENYGSGTRLFTDLSSYFKENAFVKSIDSDMRTGLSDTGGVRIENMLMYAILVAQSIILFIAYVKRLFYIIMLAMFAPVVVVFDFFQKFGK